MASPSAFSEWAKGLIGVYVRAYPGDVSDAGL